MSGTEKQSWLETRLPIGGAVRALIAEHPIPRTYSYGATLGAVTAFALLLLAASGFVLALTYWPSEGRAFWSIQETIRAVNFGDLIHGVHETGTTMLFAVLYLRLFRQLRHRDYAAPGEIAWFVALAQFALLLLVGWIGFVLADGAMSYWSLNDAVGAAGLLPGAAGSLATWFFGGAALNDGTLARLAIFHYVLAFAAIGLVLLHFAARRACEPGLSARESLPFHPYGTAKTFVSIVVFALIFAILLFFHPHLGAPRENFVVATPLSVPVAVTPPWYLAPFAAIAATVPSGIASVIAVIAAFAVLAVLPWLDRGTAPGPIGTILTWILALDVLGLGILGAHPPNALSAILGVILTLWYFFHFLVLLPVFTARKPASARAA